MSSMIKENGVTFKELEKKFCMGLQDWETVYPGASGKIWPGAEEGAVGEEGGVREGWKNHEKGNLECLPWHQ